MFRRPRSKKTPGKPELAGRGVAPVVVTSVDELADRFKGFRVDQIEVWVEAAVETGGFLKLFVSAEAKGGLKVTLKPRTA